MTDNRVPQSRSDIEEHLREQVGFVLASIERFDGGEVAEAKRMAAHIRTVLHDGHGKSLFTQLGLKRGKRGMLFYDTADDFTDPSIAHAFGCVSLTLSMGPSGQIAVWTPALDPSNLPRDATRRGWHSWWTRWVMKDSPTTGFARRDIVLPVAQQDGGVHVDPALDKHYAELSRSNSMRWMADTGAGPRPMPYIELMCVRHIAHELLVTLACQVDWAFQDDEVRLQYLRETFEADGATGRVKRAGRRPSFSLLRQVK